VELDLPDGSLPRFHRVSRLRPVSSYGVAGISPVRSTGDRGRTPGHQRFEEGTGMKVSQIFTAPNQLTMLRMVFVPFIVIELVEAAIFGL